MTKKYDSTFYEFAKGMLRYDAETGELFWTVNGKGRGSRHIQEGKRAGCLMPSGYRVVKKGAVLLYEHRIAWFLTYGWLPEEIDHINHQRDDNRLVNLRAVSRLENHRNTKKCGNNSSGVCGVSFDTRKRVWAAYIGVQQKLIHLGKFKAIDDAVNARQTAGLHYGFHENHGK